MTIKKAQRSVIPERLADSEACNRKQLTHRSKKDGRIFSVQFKGNPYYPGFQFDVQ